MFENNDCKYFLIHHLGGVIVVDVFDFILHAVESTCSQYSRLICMNKRGKDVYMLEISHRIFSRTFLEKYPTNPENFGYYLVEKYPTNPENVQYFLHASFFDVISVLFTKTIQFTSS